VTPLDLDVPARPWKHNPSSWRQRVPICVLASVAFLAASYMALYQWRLVDTVWDPVFGDQTRRVLDSEVSESLRGWFGIPDAALGALAYLGDVIFGLAGSTRRWQYRPWLVLLFGLDVIPLGIVSAVLVVLQGTVVGSWCFLCLLTAAISLALVVMSYDEVWSSIVHLRDQWRRERSWSAIWRHFWGMAPRERAAAGSEPIPEPIPWTGAMWARDVEFALGAWLVVSPFVFGHRGALAAHDFVCGSAIATLALLSYWRRARRAHLLELAIAAWLVASGWIASSEGAGASAQNHAVLGLVLTMLAIVPSEANRPPRGRRAALAR
jgi:uncharacterized membrane protein